MRLHLVYTPRGGNAAVAAQITEASQRLTTLARRTRDRIITDGQMEADISEIVSALVDVERYLQDPNMDWRTAP